MTIGETVRWTITGTVPSGEIGFWPVVQENSLPQGFAYLPGTTVISGAALDTVNHPQNPLSNGSRELRWFVQTLNNSLGNTPLIFSGQGYAYDGLDTSKTSWRSPKSTATATIRTRRCEGSTCRWRMSSPQPIEIVAGADDGRIYAWHADGTMLAGRPRSATLAVRSTTFLMARQLILVSRYWGNCKRP